MVTFCTGDQERISETVVIIVLLFGKNWAFFKQMANLVTNFEHRGRCCCVPFYRNQLPSFYANKNILLSAHEIQLIVSQIILPKIVI